jgi:hypothetical protein
MEETLTFDNMFPNCEFWTNKIGLKLLNKLLKMQDKKSLPERESLFVHFLPKLDINFIISVITISTLDNY